MEIANYTINGRSIELETIRDIIDSCVNDAFRQVQNILNIPDGGGEIDTRDAEESIFQNICINIEHNQRIAQDIRDAEIEKMKHEIYADMKDQLEAEIRTDIMREMKHKAEAEIIFGDSKQITITISTK